MRIAVVLALTAFTVAAEPPQPGLYELAGELFSADARVREQARDALIARNDPAIAAALVDALFFNASGRVETVAVLEHLLGEKHGIAFKKWIETIGRREDLTPAPGYLTFKAGWFAKIDPAFTSFLREDAPRTIRAEEIVWGGVKKDGIPALDNPKFIDARQATWLSEDEIVFGVVRGGDVRAYPERILAWHEMANDRVGGRAVSLSYCTLCGAAILYDGEVSSGQTLTFGSSGLLYRSNKLMYDRQTNTLWSQLTGEPVVGALVGKAAPLRVLPLTVTTWRAWRERHPRTRVLSLETGHVRDYTPGAAYGRYFASAETMFPVWKRPVDSPLAPKAWVLVVSAGPMRRIYPLEALARAGLVHDRIGDQDVVIAGERAYAADGRRMEMRGGQLVDATTGERFTIEEERLAGASGTTLPRLPAHRAFWFGAYAFYPGTEVWQPER